ncbi:MAG: PKD domain-containing protein [Planctomycetota bacterium]
MPSRSLACVIAAALAALPAAGQAALVAPNGLATVDGNNNGGYPWNVGSQSMRIQFVYDSTNFTLQGVTAPVVIERLRFRPDAAIANWPGGSWPAVRIDLATCTTDHLTVGASFAGNLGSDARTAFEGEVVVSPGACTTIGVPQPWHIDLLLTAPFPYDPSAGDLVVDVQLDGTGWNGVACQADFVQSTSTVPALGTNVFSTAGATATTGIVGAGRVAVCEFTWRPVNVLLAAFATSAVAGPSPFSVQFTDHSWTNVPGGVIAWQWDFDGDGVTDSTLPSPTFLYTGCGDFTVSLTVQDGVHPASTRTRPGLVRTDRITAAFSLTPLGAGAWQCSDATMPPATAWAWDFDGDGVTDSTQQNPIAPLGSACSGSIRLLATRFCRTSTAVTAVLQAPVSYGTTLLAGTGTTSQVSSTVGTLFDLQVLPGDGVLVCGLTTATFFGSGPYDVDVYITPGSYVGKDTNPAVWRRVATGRGTMAGGTVITPSINQVPLDAPFYLPAGSYGVAIWHTVPYGWAYAAFSLASTGPYSGSDLVFHPSPATAPGIARTALFGGNALSPRQWNGAFHYTRWSLNFQGGYGVFALGCAGSAGVPGNVVRRHPALGDTMLVDLTNLAQNLVLYWWGFSNTTSPFGPLPLDLAALGAPGCAVHANLEAAVLLAGAGGTATFQFAVPGSPALLGLQCWTQGLSFDAGANALGLVATDAAGFIVGQ